MQDAGGREGNQSFRQLPSLRPASSILHPRKKPSWRPASDGSPPCSSHGGRNTESLVQLASAGAAKRAKSNSEILVRVHPARQSNRANRGNSASRTREDVEFAFRYFVESRDGIVQVNGTGPSDPH
jgi:hypothetical protein